MAGADLQGVTGLESAIAKDVDAGREGKPAVLNGPGLLDWLKKAAATG
jgi:hypothetical protein